MKNSSLKPPKSIKLLIKYVKNILKQKIQKNPPYGGYPISLFSPIDPVWASPLPAAIVPLKTPTRCLRGKTLTLGMFLGRRIHGEDFSFRCQEAKTETMGDDNRAY